MAYGSSKKISGSYVAPAKNKAEKNDGGLLGGAGYLVGSAIAGLAGGAEGIIDIGTALVSDLTGDHDYAEYVFKDNVVGDWHADLTEDFNPGTGWKFAGDVAHGVGQSSWFLLSLIPGAQWLGPAVFGTGMIGQGISSAAEQTGDVGIKEVAYGVTTAALETGLETALGGMGKVAKTGVKAVAGATGKQTIKSLATSAARKGLASKLFSAAAGEFAEEFTSELADTFLQKAYQINPNAEYSLKDALYAGMVGAVSGGVTAGSVNVIDTSVKRAKGAQLIKSGNAQTTVNTANYVADKLAASGTNFKNAPEWVKTLRGEVDAYNKLVKAGKGESASAQTILGEMQASLYFAESQAIHSGIVENIKNSDENNRAALAEYINKNIDKSKRKRDYNAQDIANNTDDITTQLGIMVMSGASFFNFDSAIADMAQESAIEGVIEKERSDAAKRAAARSVQSAESGVQGEAEAVPVNDEAFAAAQARAVDTVQGAESGVPSEMLQADVNATPTMVGTAEIGAIKHDLSSDGVVAGAQGVPVTDAAKMSQEANKPSEGSVESKANKTTAKSVENGETIEKSSESKNKSIESKKSEAKSGEPKINEAKESLTDEQRAERAKKQADAWIEWEKKTAPTAKELNTAREYVKVFDNLSQSRKAAIVRMIRSAEGKVDKKILNGVANLMAITPKADIEIRFADGIGNGGLYTHVGNKALIILDSSANYKATIQGTIAHELVHYLENKAGYNDFAAYVMKRVKPEKRAEVEARYNKQYTDVYTAEAKEQGLDAEGVKKYVADKMATKEYKALIESEVVANYVGQALNNEKLLKKYADKDKKFIARVGEWLLKKATSLRKKKDADNKLDIDEELIKIADEMAFRVSVLVQDARTTGEISKETKYIFVGENAKTADKLKLATAKEMLESGADSETVRRDTGWFKGYDGKWRFEIDDSNMKIIKDGLLLKEGKYTLEEVIFHEGLFEAYPELAKMEVVVQRGGFAKGAVGAYIADQDVLGLNQAIYLRDEDLKKVIIHEIQHKIQRIEGFARGSSPDYWEKKGITEEEYNDFVAKTERELAKAKKGLSDSDREKLNEYYALGKKQDELYSKLDFKKIFDEEENAKMQAIIDQISPIEKRHDELYDYLYHQPWFSRINDLYYQTEIGDKLNTVFYKNTAGEIEARNAAERINLSAEERKNTRPDVDREDVVFAESADNLSIIANLKDTQGNSYGRAVFLDTKVFNGINTRNWWRVVEANLNNRIQKSGTAIMFIYDESGNQQILEFARPNERVNNHPVLGELYRTQDNISKLSVIHVDEIVDVSADSNPYYTLPTKNTWIDQNGWLHRYAYVVDSLKNVIYKVNFDIAKTKDGRHLLYSMRGKIERIGDADVSSLIFEERDSRRTTDSDNSIPQKSDLSTPFEKKYDLADDAAYLSAVKSGDMETAQRMVDEAAKKAGFTVKGYHGTPGEVFTKFDNKKIGSNTDSGIFGHGFYFSTDENTANIYATEKGNIMPVFLNVGKAWWAVAHRNIQDVAIELGMDETALRLRGYGGKGQIVTPTMSQARQFSSHLQEKGYDSVVVQHGKNNYEIVIFNPERIKSSDPVTYDDDGNVIPLSQRFNLENPDIRYDLADEVTETPKKKAKTKAEVIAENRELRAENRELKESKNQMRGMLEKLNRERAELSKAENAEVFDKSDVELAVKSIESWTEEEALSLAKGNVELNKMGKAKREEMISQIYIALHEQGAVGRTGPGSIAVKSLAAKIAGEYIDSAAVMGEDGKLYHLADIYDEVTMGKLKQELTNLLYGEFAHMGKSTGVNELVAQMRAQKQAFRQERFNDATIAKAAKDVAYQAHELRKLAEQQKREGATEGIQRVTNKMAQAADAKGNVSVKLLDTAIGEASRFLSGEAFKSESISGEEAKKESILDFDAVVDGELKFKIDEYLRLREEHKHKTLTAEEMRLAGEILRKMKATIERYNKEYINGHYVEVDELVVSAVSDLISFSGKQKDYKNKVTKFLGEKLGKKANEWYFYQILSPETVIEAIEGYKQGGLLKSLYHSVRVAKQKAEHRAVQMKKPFAEFLDNKENAWEEEKDGKIRKHSYRNKLNKKIINVNGNEITLGEAIYLLMLTKREHAHRGLQESGYKCYSDDGQVTASFKVLDIERTRDLIYNQLDKTDLEFLKMAEEFFNVTSTKVKQDADYLIFGYTNTQDTYYVPIIRDRYSRMNGVTDARQSIGSIITVYNKSFNQNTVQNAKALEGKSIMRIINDHADGLADYAEMYLPLKAFDRVYNRGVIGADGKTTTIREVVGTKVWNGAEGYFKELFQDMQGQSRQNDSTMLNRAVGFMRSAWVNSVLGANIKVVATQTTSLGAATQIIEPKYITAALSVIGKRDLSELRTRAYEYSDIIEARNFDMGALKAQGNIDKVGKIGEKTGFLIGWMDERICFAIFHAAELKVEAQGGGAVGTEANAIAAARIADEAIYTTQAMSSASERSALQRSPNEILKVFSMFTSDSVKNLSHLYGNIMKFIAHSERVKAGDASYEALLENDKKEILRSARTIAITGIMLGVITQAFKYLYAKEEEEPEDKLKDFGLDIVSSTLNILPGVSDVIDKFVFNYDMSVNVLDVANDTIETFGKGAKLAGKSMNGEFVSTQDVASVMIDIIKSTLSFGGIPISPIERTVTGLLRRFAPSAIYGYDAMFSNPSYTADLKKAVESGDEALAEYVLDQLYKNEVNGIYTSDELEEVVRLYGLTDEEGKHYNVLPQKVGAEINGVKLKSAQRKKFMSIYSGASAEVNKLIGSSYYTVLTDEQRAKAIRNIYSMYYDRAAAEVAGKEWSNAVAYSYLTNNYTALFAAQAYKSGLSEQKDASGKKITVGEQFVEYAKNLGLSESDYVVITYANGVRNKSNKAAFIAYINSLSLSPEVKAQIAERLGFEIKDGVVVEKKE